MTEEQRRDDRSIAEKRAAQGDTVEGPVSGARPQQQSGEQQQGSEAGDANDQGEPAGSGD
jgi:hypothetical protein